jgi:plastocyanin
MSNETLFYVCGVALAVSAVLVSFAGLRFKGFPGRIFPLVVIWFAVLIGSATSFAVLHAKDEQDAKAAELGKAGEEIEKAQSGAPEESQGTGGGEEPQPSTVGEPVGGGKGPGGTLQLAADPSAIAFDKTSLTSKPGKVTIEFDNPAPIEHDVVIEQEGKRIAASPLIAQGKTSVSAELAPGTYTFLCDVEGHAAAGMEGTLTVR